MTTVNGPARGQDIERDADASLRSREGARPTGSEHSHTDETKHATKTSEFWVFVGLALGLLIASAVADGFGVNRFWLFATILTVGYLVSRGLAKALRGRGQGNETKPSFKTTEFWIFLAALAALFITGLATGDGGVGEVDTLGADRVWLYAAVIGVGYLVSRGLAKSGAGASTSTDHGRAGQPMTERVRAAADAFSNKR